MSSFESGRNSPEVVGITFKVKHRFNPLEVFKIFVWNSVFIIFFVFATLNFVWKKNSCVGECDIQFCSPYSLLLVITVILYLVLFYLNVVKKYFGEVFEDKCIQPSGKVLRRVFATSISRLILFITILALLITLIIFETRDDFHRLRALIGIVSFIVIGYIFSYDKFAVNWRTVLCGFSLQFLLGVFCIRWDVGRTIFKCFSDKVAAFLHYSQDGAAFVFGDFLVIETNVVAFAALTTIFFFSTCISVLYYLGVMQWVLMNLGWVLQKILGTTVCESVNAAGNIFLGQSESPLLIRPYIRYLTNSEMHAILVSGFSTVAGAGLVIYISFGAEAYHLVTASVMAAPASLFFSKLFYPETENSLTSSKNIQLERSKDTSFLDAASSGAKSGIEIFLNIIANLIAFVALLAFTDGMIKWFTFLLGFEDVGIQFILGKVFIPVSWALGVEWGDCEAVGHVIGTKTFVNELVAFRLLGEYKKAGEISLRSSAIATYAICGFANPGSMGVMIGALSAFAPERRPSITKVVFRAFISGCIVSLITASIAGLLMTDEMIESGQNVKNSTHF